MLRINKLTDKISIAHSLAADDFEALAARGFQTIINFRPDGEAVDQLPADDARQAAERAGLRYEHIPATKFQLFTDEIVGRAAEVLSSARGNILAHCASGQRAAVVWAAATSRTQPVDAVLTTLASAGYDFGFLRDDLEAQADRGRWSGASELGTLAGRPEADALEAA